MATEREQRSGSFRDDIDELLTRLTHEGVVGAGMQRSGRARPKNAARSPAWHNRALFDRRRD